MPPASAASLLHTTSCHSHNHLPIEVVKSSALLTEKSSSLQLAGVVMTATTAHNKNNNNNKPVPVPAASPPTRISSRRRSAPTSPTPGENSPSPEASPTLASPVAATKRPLQTSFAKEDVEVTPPNGANTHDNECEEEEEDAAAAAAAAAASLITSVKKRRRTRGTYPTLRLHTHTHARSFSHSFTHLHNLPRLCHRLISSQVGAADHLRGQRRHRAVNTHGRRRAAAL